MISFTRLILNSFRREIRSLAYQRRSLATDVCAAKEAAERQDSEVHSSEESPDRPEVPSYEELRERLRPDEVEYVVDDFRHLIQNDENQEKKLHLILLELANLRDTTERAPRIARDKDIQALLMARSRMQRAKYFDFMFKREMSELNDRARREKRKLEAALLPRKPTKMTRAIYPLIRETQQNLHYNNRMAMAAMFGQKLVIDCSFEGVMNYKELKSLLNQIQYSYASNRISRDPFDLILSDVAQGGLLDKTLADYLPQLNSNSCLVTKTSERYIDMFPKDKILYLTPNSNRVLKKWDHDAVVIIGGIVDKGQQLAHTLGKAREQGVSHAKLPLGFYAPSFTVNTSQALGVNTVVDVLLRLKETASWEEACKKIPSRLIARNQKSYAKPSRFGSLSTD